MRFRLAWFPLLLAPALGGAQSSQSVATEFCLDGQLDLGVRLQGMRPAAGERVATSWCVITETGSERVRFRGNGASNPDMVGEFTVAYLPPDVVRIVNGDSPPDVEFRPADSLREARRHRRMDPVRLVEELEEHADWMGPASADGWQEVRYPGEAEAAVRLVDERLAGLRSRADLPLRGRVPVEWTWQWSDRGEPQARLLVDGELLFEATGRWRTLEAAEAAQVWQPSGGVAPVAVDGAAWPARVDMQIEELGDSAWFVRGVRTGFHHLVVDTSEGLVVGDAPAGWVEFQQIPPADLVPGLGISGLSEGFVDFLAEHFPGRPLRAVALTHAHDDHAGGARAFAAAGAHVYAPEATQEFVEAALNRADYPADRFGAGSARLDVLPVRGRTRLSAASGDVELIDLRESPHTSASLGLWAIDAGLFFQSDLHVPNSDADVPRADRLETECWFARWAVEHLPAETVVLSSHGTFRSPVSLLARYLESAACRAVAPSR